MEILRRNNELLIWIAALAYLKFFVNPFQSSGVCFSLLWDSGNCPGCGLGRSMAHFLDGNILASMDMHLLGIPTLVVIFYRIIDLIGKHRTRTLYLNQRIK